jgi:hypothetical protein
MCDACEAQKKKLLLPNKGTKNDNLEQVRIESKRAADAFSKAQMVFPIPWTPTLEN